MFEVTKAFKSLVVERPSSVDFFRVLIRVHFTNEVSSEEERSLKRLPVRTVVNLRDLHHHQNEIGRKLFPSYSE